MNENDDEPEFYSRLLEKVYDDANGYQDWDNLGVFKTFYCECFDHDSLVYQVSIYTPWTARRQQLSLAMASEVQDWREIDDISYTNKP